MEPPVKEQSHQGLLAGYLPVFGGMRSFKISIFAMPMHVSFNGFVIPVFAMIVPGMMTPKTMDNVPVEIMPGWYG